ncbi:hypothetical protein RJ641_025207 [Dillenia turbinata]|uniref:Uncharacterized protein n=1 Tax=Dillenia turbinata TaxID=194707 RepID=A0AAN8W170_9MAGN
MKTISFPTKQLPKPRSKTRLLLSNLTQTDMYNDRFRQQNATCVSNPYPNSPTTITTSSKELLYFFCSKTQQATRVEPYLAQHSPPSHLPPQTASAVDVLKWHRMYGPSRVLPTIKEEEEEDLETCEKSSCTEKIKNGTDKTMSSEECIRVTNCDNVEVTSAAFPEEVEKTPFSTPCASPAYFPSRPPPPREVAVDVHGPFVGAVQSSLAPNSKS